MPDQAREHFAPVWDHERGWVLMPHAEMELTDEGEREVWTSLSVVGWVDEDVNQPHQLVRIDGAPVSIDY